MEVIRTVSMQLSFEVGDIPTDLFIAGNWRAGSAGGRIVVSDHSTGLKIADVADASIEDAMAAVGTDQAAAPAWPATAPRKRSDILRRCFELMIERKPMLAELISLENGKTLSDGWGR